MQQNISTADVERVIRRLRSVLAVSVQGNGGGEIEEIHVTVDEAHSPKQVGRDIESALASELGLRIDHRKISIAQVRGRESAVAGLRLQLVNISFSVDRQSAQARVSLGLQDETFVGLASAPSYRYDQLRLVAEATLRAVEEFLYSAAPKGEPRPSLMLEEFKTVSLDGTGREAAMVTVRAMRTGGEEILLGTATVRQDPWRAIACAALDALNRRLVSFVE